MGCFPDALEDEADLADGAGAGGAGASLLWLEKGLAITYCDIGFGLRVRSLRRSVAGDLLVKDRSLSLCLMPLRGGSDWLRGVCRDDRGLATPDRCVTGVFHDPALASQRCSRSCAFFLASFNSWADLNLS
tara:strand:+ start:79 stop:471 length:393 start_codon:yes stop_codon:yes gene_type:complete